MAHSGGRVLEQKAWSVTWSEGIHTAQGGIHTTDYVTCVTRSEGIHTGQGGIHTTDHVTCV